MQEDLDFNNHVFSSSHISSLADLKKDVQKLNSINTTKFVLDTAHQKQDLIHRSEQHNRNRIYFTTFKFISLIPFYKQ